MSDKTATERLRELLDERGVEWTENDGEHVKETSWPYMGELDALFVEYDNGTTRFTCDTWCFTPEQAIAATIENERLAFPEKLDAVAMEREQQSDPMWEQWYEGLRHDEIKTIGDAVEQLMYESIKNGGYMGPNGNTYGGVDEGEVATLDFINSWVAKFGTMLGADRGTCHDTGGTDENGQQVFNCNACGCVLSLYHRDGTNTMCTNFIYDYPRYCPECRRRVVDE